MWVVNTVAVLVTFFFVWQMNARRMEALGRGWFVRNWLASIVAGLACFIQILLFSADGIFWNLLGFVFTVSAVSLRFAPREKDTSLDQPMGLK